MKLRTAIVVAIAITMGSPAVSQTLDPLAFHGAIDHDPQLVCSMSEREPPTPFGEAKALISALYYAQQASDRSKEIGEADTSNVVAFMTDMMRATKHTSGDYACAEDAMADFNNSKIPPNMRVSAQLLIMSWNQQIALNKRILAFTSRLDTMKSAEIATSMSDFLVERDKLIGQMSPPTEFILLSLKDDRRPNPSGLIDRLTITGAQASDLKARLLSRFPTVETDDPKKMAMPEFLASLSITLLKSKASDAP